jgi:hypothetical protein
LSHSAADSLTKLLHTQQQNHYKFNPPLPLCLLYGSTVIHIILLLFFGLSGRLAPPDITLVNFLLLHESAAARRRARKSGPLVFICSGASSSALRLFLRAALQARFRSSTS